MIKTGREKSSEDILKEEFLQERAAVLGRAGEKVSAAIEKLRGIEEIIEKRLSHLDQIVEKCRAQYGDGELVFLRRQILKEINVEIGKFNRAREHAKVRYYYLVVTREAMGMNRHHWIEDVYRIPPRKKQLRDD
ncbi:MAG: hypothetical protein WCH07_05135 [Deltaproteobacteria bacterium]